MDNFRGSNSKGYRATLKQVLTSTLIFLFSIQAYATKLVEVIVLDKDYILVYFKDGDVERRDNGIGDCAFQGHCHKENGSTAVYYGEPLNTVTAGSASNWLLKSTDHEYYGNDGKNPSTVYRKTKMNGMTMSHWSSADNDYVYNITREHWMYVQLPESMEQGNSYTLEIEGTTNTDRTSVEFTYDIFNTLSEAIHVNLVGYSTNPTIKSADLYHWMGDGGARDYSDFEGNDVYIYNVNTEESQVVGSVSFWKESTTEGSYNFTRSNVWNIDFTGFNEPGTYRLAVEGVGCSQDFEIADGIFYELLRTSTRGHFYMRVGQDSPEITPRPRLPLFNPAIDGTKVFITTMHPYHSNWKSFSSGDQWDKPNDWQSYKTGDMNPNAWGGWSDAYDWDRHGGHVSSIWDILLPYIVTGGALTSDDFGIAESGNGIPDVIDEARSEVDFFLRIRIGMEYSHGLTCPISNTNRTLYQAGGSAISAWYNAVNSAMLAEAFRISGNTGLMEVYRDSAIVAYNFALTYANQRLDDLHGIGEGSIRGRDMKMTAAAFLYNVTGDTYWEDQMASENIVTGSTSAIQRYQDGNFNQSYGVIAYLFTPRTINYPAIHNNMRAAIINEAKNQEANNVISRPSRRGNDKNTTYFKNVQNMHRTIIAHAVTTEPSEREFFENALTLEADWGLGRNPSNFIQMTTASTSFESKRSVQAAYTSGYNDGTPGLHPGHTPYHNMDDWASGMIMGRPSWMALQGYPAQGQWPAGELWFNTDYVWSHGEFTPRQTMRGKQALYGYLYGIGQEYIPSGKLTLTVNQGSGGGQYQEAEEVNIIAYSNENGQPFSMWTGDVDYVQDINSASTILTMPSYSVAVTATYADLETYSLAVIGGSGSGVFVEGKEVSIIAHAAPVGQKFSEWIGDVDYLADVNSKFTTFTMPASDATITATYEDIVTFSLTVEGGTGSGEYEEGTVVNITANAAPTGKQFAHWTGDVSFVADSSKSTTTLTMPESNATITATYKEVEVNVDGILSENINVYPNPTNNGLVNIILTNTDKADARVFDLTGRIVLTAKLTQGINTLVAEDLQNGIYILKINTISETYTHRLLVER
jgi:endoglucanase